ncbi:MAG: hypothetical protein ACI9WU_003566 [Myxococcota bacterium]
MSILGELAHQTVQWANERPAGGLVDPVTLTLPSGATVTKSPELAFGLGTVRWALGDLIRRRAPDLLDTEANRPEALRLAGSANAVLKGLLGGAIFDPNKPGALKRAAVQRLADELGKIQPDTMIAGTTARAVYRLFRKPIREYALVYGALLRTPGKAKSVRAWRKHVRKHANPDTHYNQKMLAFYTDFANKHAVGKTAGLGHRWDMRVIAGFWIRRMADGTDKILWNVLTERLQTFDPELLAELP